MLREPLVSPRCCALRAAVRRRDSTGAHKCSLPCAPPCRYGLLCFREPLRTAAYCHCRILLAACCLPPALFELPVITHICQ